MLSLALTLALVAPSPVFPSAKLLTRTTSPLTMYLDPTGSDSGSCTLTSPCATPQGLIKKIPKGLRDLVTVNFAAGSYGCFYVQGFMCDFSNNNGATGGLLFDGLAAFVTSTLATGSATGTATAGSAGSGVTYGTLTNSGAAFTTADLRGRFLKITSGTGSGQQKLISTNSATVITIVGPFSPAPDNTSGYIIQDPGAIINTACSISNPLDTTTTDNAAILVSGNSCGARKQSIVFRGLRLTGAGGGLFFSDQSGGFLTLSQVRATGASSEGVLVGGGAATSAVSGVGRFDITDVEIDAPTNTAGFRTFSGLSVLTRLLVHNGNGGVIASDYGRVSISTLDTQTVSNPAVATQNGRIAAMSGAHLDCSNAGDYGLSVSQVNPVGFQGQSVAIATTVQVSTCGWGASVMGTGSLLEITSLSGTAATNGIIARAGGSAIYNKATTTITAGSNEIGLDSGDTPGTFAGVTAGSCLVGSTTGWYSKVCAR